LKNSGLIISSGLDSEDAEDREDAGPDIELRQLVFGAAQHGLRLDRALAELVPEFSRSYLQQLIDLGGVSINGAVVCKPSTRIKAAERGVVELRPTPQVRHSSRKA
jgi:23S rRNA pseudouridine1911/1915/1917 synthase